MVQHIDLELALVGCNHVFCLEITYQNIKVAQKQVLMLSVYNEFITVCRYIK